MANWVDRVVDIKGVAAELNKLEEEGYEPRFIDAGLHTRIWARKKEDSPPVTDKLVSPEVAVNPRKGKTK